MADVHIEEHSSLIKTPQQLFVVVLLSFIVPVAAILLLVKLITGGMHIDPDSVAMSEDAVANRLKPVGEVRMVGDAESAASGEAVVATTPKPAEQMDVAAAASGGAGAMYEVTPGFGLETTVRYVGGYLSGHKPLGMAQLSFGIIFIY